MCWTGTLVSEGGYRPRERRHSGSARSGARSRHDEPPRPPKMNPAISRHTSRGASSWAKCPAPGHQPGLNGAQAGGGEPTNVVLDAQGTARRRAGETISTSFAESAVNQVISKRMVRKQQMRWSPAARTYYCRSTPASSTTPSPTTTDAGTRPHPHQPAGPGQIASHGLSRSPRRGGRSRRARPAPWGKASSVMLANVCAPRSTVEGGCRVVGRLSRGSCPQGRSCQLGGRFVSRLGT